MIHLSKFLQINESPYQILVINNFINKKICTEIIKEILRFNKYDDEVMNGRHRINKGSKNFTNFLKKSKNIRKLYKNINNLKFYKKLDKLLDKNNKWIFLNKINYFSKKNYGLQKGNILTKNLEKKFIKNSLNLDIDFSCSNYGYFRSAHRDRDNRVINFLIYLNTIKKRDGGALEIFDVVKKKFTNKFPRFPNIKNLKKVNSLSPKQGKFIVFRSTPESYHGVSKFKSHTEKRIFLYGSFSLNNPVHWKKNKIN
tara:strand:- start:1443 stop:2207 length:765 start_codon:yes stop_codon:yes gene_type:complete